MTYYVYILYSSKKDCFYIGETEDVETRLKSHLSGISKFTTRADDWKVVYTKQFQTRTEAIKREREIKRKKSRKYIELLIMNGN